jgi:formylglycine-generating enzyme required for sulfatase activity
MADTFTDLTTNRILVFEQRYGRKALHLAYHAAFPLTLTSDLLYCLRENFLPDVPWYAVPDILLSGLCQTAGYDLYEIEGKTRSALLYCLCRDFGDLRLKELSNFMVEYIASRLDNDNTNLDFLNTVTEWTALSFVNSEQEKSITDIKRKLEQLINSSDKKDSIRWTVLAKVFDDLLPEKGFKPLFIRNRDKDQDEGTKLAAAMGVKLLPLEFKVKIITLEDEQTEELQPFDFEVVNVDTHGQVIKREKQQAFYFVELLGEGKENDSGNDDELLPQQAQLKPIGLEMVAIPGDTFIMGSSPEELEHKKNESPQHSVKVQPFFMGKYPVTQAQWRFVAKLPQMNKELDPNPSNFKGDNRPVEQVSWEDAVEFCLRLSQYTGRTYSLPSEAEWEYACRAGTTTPFHFGETITTDLANYDGNYAYGQESEGVYREETTAVGSFGVANNFGLYDMHGNVWEWCLDDWHDNYKGAPTDGSPWFNSDDKLSDKSGRAVMRGGSWINDPQNCRSASRDDDTWGGRVLIYNPFGFRVVCVVGRTLR